MWRLLLIDSLLLLAAPDALAAESDPPQWIVVAAPDFTKAIERLVAHRRSEGMEVTVLPVSGLSKDADGPADPERLRGEIGRLRRGRKGPAYVLLVGLAEAGEKESKRMELPALAGTASRMKGVATDHAFGLPDDKLLPSIAVGRFPARTAKEAAAMVEKTLAFERHPGGGWRNRLVLLQGNPGGSTELERRSAESVAPSQVMARFGKLGPEWTAKFITHASGSPFNVPDDELRDTSLGYLRDGQFWSIYLGHSSAPGFWSAGARFLDRKDWGELSIPRGPGLFFTCGCFACQTSGYGGEGYALAAIRNPAGPIAVVGAHAESYSAFGLLAMEGLLAKLREKQPPSRLADYWLAIENSIVHGEMDPITFWILDNADGSRGKISLADQRREHAEMWTLLGDPALRMPPAPLAIDVKTSGDAAPGRTVEISGVLPRELAAAKVRVTIERPLDSKPARLLVADQKTDDRATVRENHRRANNFELDSKTVEPTDGQFRATLRLPNELPWPKVVVRAVAETEADFAQGVQLISTAK